MSKRKAPDQIKRKGWGLGKTVTAKGYVRLTRGPYRFQYEHRAVASQLWQETYGCPMPPDKEVHHQDFNRANNTPSNLLILDPPLHEGHNHCHRKRDGSGKWVRQRPCPQPQPQPSEPSEPPDWVTALETDTDTGMGVAL